MPIATSEICDRLESIQDQIRQACKDFSKLSFDEFDQSLAPAWDQESSDPTCIPNMGKLADALRNNKTMQKTGRASSLLLGCAAIHKVMISVICNPLFALGGEVGLNAAFRHGFGQVLGFAANGDEAAAEALRCQLLRLVDPPKDSNSSTITSMKAIVKESRDTASDQLAQLFLDELSRTYEEEQSARALPVFEKIFREAAELSALLWTRKTRIRHSCPGPRYYSASGDIAAHPFHRAELEDDPRILDGKDIVVLYSPAIWLYGTDDGQNFHQRRLVKKAVAWMG